MTHTIDGFGKIEFSIDSIRQSHSTLFSNKPVIVESSIEFSSVAPEWKHAAQSQDIYQRVIEKSTLFPIMMKGDFQARALALLHKGDYLVVRFTNRESRNEETQVIVSPIRFQAAYKEFSTCRAGLDYIDYTDIEHTRLYYKSGDSRLGEKSRSDLGKIADYIKAKGIRYRLTISGYTDNVGAPRKNKRLAQKRINQVVQYLLKKGLSKRAISTKAYGERRPIKSNRTDAGRAANRRVELVLTKLDG